VCVRIGGVDQLEKVDELAAAMAVLDQGMDFAGDEIDPASKLTVAVALVLKLAGEGRVHARLGPASPGAVVANRLNAGLLVIGDEPSPPCSACFFLRSLRPARLLQDGHPLAGRRNSSTCAHLWP